MAERPVDIDLTTSTAPRAKDPSAEEVNAYRNRLAQVLDRALTVDRLHVDLPDDLTPYWCPNDSLSIAQAEMRGFKMDTEHAVKNKLNDSSDGKARFADVVFMIRPKWMKLEEDKLIAKRYHDAHISDKRKQKEEKDFLSQNELPAIVSSSSSEVSGAQITEALKQ